MHVLGAGREVLQGLQMYDEWMHGSSPSWVLVFHSPPAEVAIRIACNAGHKVARRGFVALRRDVVPRTRLQRQRRSVKGVVARKPEGARGVQVLGTSPG